MSRHPPSTSMCEIQTGAYIFTIICMMVAIAGWTTAVAAIRNWERERKRKVRWSEIF